MNRRAHGAAAALAVLCLATGTAGAQAEPPDRSAFALVIGSNAGGEGQAPLRYAEADAGHVADVLRDLGGYPRDQVDVLLHPTRAQVDAALDRLASRAVAESGAGRPPRVFFYYSGHARSAALNLGREELPLADLRQRLIGISSGLTVIVLDACQSGAFSRVKGAEPSADFSYNSLARLSATGVAVLASSSASELSQESDRLGSSYFTHHLLAGLRGAGDASGDGKVSLDEAYRYAYHRTLVATAATAVGAQHVSLEVDLKGKGEVAITTPSSAAAHLVLAGPLQGEVLVERRAARAVVAELHKARGAPVRLGLPAGGYSVLVRIPNARHLRRCTVDIAPGAVGQVGALEGCEKVALVDDPAKGRRPWYRPPLAIEFGLGAIDPIDDEFTRTLEGFGYREGLAPGGRLQLSVNLVGRYGPHFAAVVTGTTLASRTFERDGEARTIEYTWQSYAWGLGARASLPLWGGRLTPFAQVGGGLAMATTSFANATGGTDEDVQWGWDLNARGGLAWRLGRRWSLLGEASYTTAPIIDNLIGDTHDAGGTSIILGARANIDLDPEPEE